MTLAKNQAFTLAIILFTPPCSAEPEGWYAKGRMRYSGRIAVKVINLLDIHRMDAPVVIPMDRLRKIDPSLEGVSLTVVDPAGKRDGRVRRERNGADIPSQVDDLDGDGTLDELAFVVDLRPRETKRVFVYYGSGVKSRYPTRTYGIAGREFMPKRILTGWESEVMGFNVYAGKVDLYAKRRPGIQYDRFVYGGYGSFHHGDMGYGADILHVGGSMGCGGIEVSTDGKRFLPHIKPGPGELDRPANMPVAKVLCSGPVRTVMVLTYDDWRVGTGSLGLTDKVEIVAGARSFSHDVTVTSDQDGDLFLRSGCHSRGEKAYREGDGFLGIWTSQNPSFSDFGMGLVAHRGSKLRIGAERVGKEGGNRFIVFQGRRRVRAQFHVAAAWSQEGSVKDEHQWFAYLQEQALSLAQPVRVDIGAGERRKTTDPKPATIAGKELFICNSTPLESVLPAEVCLKDYGLSCAGESRVAECSGKRYPVDILRERGRTMAVIDVPVPKAATARVTLTEAEWNGRSPFSSRRDGAILTVRAPALEWTFDGNGLRKFSLPHKEVRGNPGAERLRVPTDGEGRPLHGRRFVVSSQAPRPGAEVRFQGRSVCIVECANGSRYTLYARSPLWKAQTRSYDEQLRGRLAVSLFHSRAGRSPASTEGRAESLDLFYPADWAVVMSPRGDMGYWVAPTQSASRLLASKEDETVRIRHKPVDPKDQEDYDALKARCHSNSGYGPWEDPAHRRTAASSTILCGVVQTPEEGRQLLMCSTPPLVVHENLAFDDFDGNGVADTVIVKDQDGNGPDFARDTWYWDMDSDGSVQSVFSFRDRAGDGLADDLLVFGDYDDCHRDGVVDLKGHEGKYPLVAYHDWTGDGIFFDNSFFRGGPTSQDWLEVQMYASLYTAMRVHEHSHTEKRGWDELDGQMDWGLQALDIDGDGDWDVGTRFGFGAKKTPHRAVLDLVCDLGDGNAAMGAVVNAATGYYFYRHFPNYHWSSDYPFWYTGEHRLDRCKDGWVPQVLDCPQGDLNLDDDPAPEVHYMGQCGVVDDELHYTVARMAIDMDNDNAGVTGPPCLTVGVHHGGGRSYDVCVLPKNFTTADSLRRLPIYPYKKASVFSDRHGNEVRVLAKYVPDGWDGKKLTVFDDDGKHRDWVRAWYWDMRQSWDLVMCLWRDGDINPESSQGWRPMHNLRYDCDLAGPYRFALYHNPVTGFMHFVGSDFGCRLGMLRKEHRELLDECWWDGFDNSWSCLPRDCDLARGYSQSFEVYLDADKDGLFDTYLVDAENDGYYERRLWHDPTAKTLTLCHHGAFFTADATCEFTSVGMELENYNRMTELFTNGKQTFSDRLLDTITVDDHGRVTAPKGIELRPDETSRPVIALDTCHVKSNPWVSHFPQGYSRLFTAFSRHQARIMALAGPYTQQRLSNVTVLVICGMDFDHLPKDAEIAALDAFIRSGGTAVVSYPEPGDVRAVILNALLEPYGIGVIKEELSYDETNDPHILAPDTYDRSRYFRGRGKYLANHIRKLYIRGYPLTIPSRTDVAALLHYREQCLVAKAQIGRGTLYVFGVPLLNNRYTAHNVKNMPKSRFEYRQSMTHIWMMPDNNRFLDRFVDSLLAD